MVRTFKESMKRLQLGDTETKLNRLLFAYRMTPNTTTGKSPAELLFQRQPRSMFHRLIPGVNKPILLNDKDKVEQQKVKSFSEDDPVWIKNFSGKDKWIAGTVIKKVSNVNYHVVLCGWDKILHRHVDQLIARIPSLGVEEEDIPEQEQDKQGEREKVRRSERARDRPVWTKDYHMLSN